MSDKISVVIPVYKVEQYLRRCINSILGQSYKNIEIILIDDGSPDKCGKICDEYKKKDSRIKVIHKVNGGLSEARNYGIDVATGEYIIFVDSDDFVNENMCEILLSNAKKYSADIVGCNFKEVFTNNKSKINEQKMKNNIEIYSNIEMIKQLYFNLTTDKNVVWNKIYKRKIFFDKKIRFPVGILHEDDYIIYKLYYKANKVVYINDILYYYFRHENTITYNFSNKNIIDLIKGRIEQYFFIKDKNENLNNIIKAHSIDFYFYINKLILKNNMNKNIDVFKILKNYKKMIIEENKNILLNPYMNLKRYIKFLLIYFNLNWILKKI